MFYRWGRRYLPVFICILFVGSIFFIKYDVREEEVSTPLVSSDVLIPGGMPVGIYMETEGVMVLGTEPLQSDLGMYYEPAEHLVKEGDYITKMNGQTIHNKKELIHYLKRISNEEVVLELRRKNEKIHVKIKPVLCKGKEYKLGIWVRDNTQGLGTVTFLDENSNYGALGHGVHDVNTNKLLELSKGRIYKTSIHSIKKGRPGVPGGIEGIIVYNRYNRLGTIDKNTKEGIYGHLDYLDQRFLDQRPVKIMPKEELKKGKAKIRCTVDGMMKEYEVEIQKINLQEKEVNKRILLKVTDQELIKKTGGIVQGMSGSPILQDGKLAGAVTHVLVNDPTRGYGILIENMLEAEK